MWMKLANAFKILKGPRETLLHANTSFLWRWARAEPFCSRSRIQFHRGQVHTRALQRCCATNTSTAAHSQYFSFSLCTPSTRCTMTFRASRASRGMSARSHMTGKYRSPGDHRCINVQGKRETCCSFILALCKPALMRPSAERRFKLLPNERGHIFLLSFPRAPCCAVDKGAVFWQLGGDALSVCT